MSFPSLADFFGLETNESDNGPFGLQRSPKTNGRKVAESGSSGMWTTDPCMVSSISVESTASTLSTPPPTAHSPRVNTGATRSVVFSADGSDKRTASRISGRSISQDLSRCVGCAPLLFQDEEEFEADSYSRWAPLPFPAEEPVTEVDNPRVNGTGPLWPSKGMPQARIQQVSSKSFPACASKKVHPCDSGCTCEGTSCEPQADGSCSELCPDIHSMEVSQKRSQSSPNVQTLHMQELEQGSSEPPLHEGIPNELSAVNFVRASAKRSVSMESISDMRARTCREWIQRRLPAIPPPAEKLAAEEFLTACGGCGDFSDQAFTADQLQVCMDEARANIQPWKPARLVRTLHTNPHTRTTVDLMSYKGAEQNKVVVKRMPNDWIEANQEEFERLHPHEREHPWHDLGILRHLNEIGYPFVCKLLWVFRDEDNTYVTSSLASEGDLHSWCRHLSRPSLSREGQLQPVARQVFSAVRWLHELGIAHRDLSLENVLLHRCYGSGSVNCEVCAGRECGLCCRCGRGVHVKLCDFAMCSMERSCTDGVRGKRSYQAPEMHLEETAYDPFLADAFALGVLLYAAAAQDYPWNSTVPEAGCDRFRYAQSVGFRKYLQLKRLRKTGPTMMQVFSEPLVTLLEGLMQMEPEKRLILGESCFMHALKETKQPEKTDTSVGANEVATVWATRWLNETYRANCFGC